VNFGLFLSYFYYRTELTFAYGSDNNMQPQLASLPLVYMPYVKLLNAYTQAQSVLAWLCLFSWVRLLKYLSLAKTFCLLIRTLEASCFQLFLFSFLYLSVTIGFSIAFVIGFGAADTTEGIYSSFAGCFFVLFFMIVGGVDLSPVLGLDSVSYMTNTTLRYLLFITYVVVLFFLFFNFYMAIVIDTYSRVSILFTEHGVERKNPCMVFLYTYYHKWRGVQLIQENEDDIGGMDEQYIELEQLPNFLIEIWQQKQGPCWR